MDLDVSFGSTQMTTPVYIKMDAHDQLLLSEGVCRQLGILQYHPDVETWRGGRKKSTPATNKPKPPSEPATPSSLPAEETPGAEEAKVPTVRVNLVQSVQLLPHQSLVVEVTCTCSFAGDGENDDSAAYLLEPTELKSGLQVEPSLLSLSAEDGVLAMINNPTGCSMALKGGSLLGEVTPVTLVNPAPNGDQTQGIPEEMSALRWIQTKPTAWRQQTLLESIGTLETLTPAQQQKLTDFLKEHNTAFALEEGERGETDLVEMHIDTDDAAPQRCPPDGCHLWSEKK